MLFPVLIIVHTPPRCFHCVLMRGAFSFAILFNLVRNERLNSYFFYCGQVLYFVWDERLYFSFFWQRSVSKANIPWRTILLLTCFHHKYWQQHLNWNFVRASYKSFCVLIWLLFSLCRYSGVCAAKPYANLSDSVMIMGFKVYYAVFASYVHCQPVKAYLYYSCTSPAPVQRIVSDTVSFAQGLVVEGIGSINRT